MNRTIFYVSIFLILTFNQIKCQTQLNSNRDSTNNADKLLEISEQGHENIGDRNTRGIGGFGGLGAGGGLYGAGFGGGVYGGGLKYRQKIVIKKRGFVGGAGGFKGGFAGGVGGFGGGGLGLGGGLGHGGLGYGGLGHGGLGYGGLGHGGFFR
ncbi:acanthoscurrin-2-like [Condylostylus longicornis]|uniref:acanthoscurrin-2-like n=1 Tax=Condylostylus longicornis TaxID=2530218 RepID=UPI00244E028D|nr:acanthoscurrin-2-like [Condylostylus longicornis]